MKKEKKEPKAEEIKPSQDWETEDDMRALMRAEMIKDDPEKMAKVKKLAGRQHKAISSIKDISEAYDAKYGSGALKKEQKES